MKKWLAVVLVISLVLVSFLTVSDPTNVEAQGEGLWVLQSTDIEKADEPEGSTYSISEGNSSLYSVSEVSGDVFAAFASWTMPENSYQGGDQVTLTLSVAVDDYIWNGKDDGYIHHGFNYMTFWVAARIDDPGLGWQYATAGSIRLVDDDGNRQPTVSTDNGTIVSGSETMTVQAVFPAGRSEGVQKSIYINSPVGQNRYTYVWQAEPEQTETSLEPATPTEDAQQRSVLLNGGVRSIDNKPMRNLQLKIDAFYLSNAESVETASPGWSQEVISDVRGGLFKADIPIPTELPDQVKIKISGRLHCFLPDGSLMFYMTDSVEPDAREAITFSTTIDVDLSESDDQGNIQVDRLLSFNTLMAQYLSIGLEQGVSDAFESNMTDLKALAAFSYHYVWAWNAQYVGGVLFGEIDDLKKHPLKIAMRWQPSSEEEANLTSNYVPAGENIIRLLAEHSRYDDASRFTLLHEYGHHFDVATVDGWHMRTIRAREANTDHTPHGGYLNSSTSDSMIEGFATAYAAIVQKTDRNNTAPHLVDIYDLGRSGNYVAWQNMGLDEELAIATLLYQTFLQYESPRAFWKVLQPDYSEFIYYYQELAKDLSDRATALAVLEQAAFDGGLYQMPFGNAQYDKGEPYRDLNLNGRFDPGEPFADLMFAVDDAGSIIPGQPMSEWEEAPVLGKSSDASRNRQTVYQLPGSFIRLTGEPITEVLVKVIPDGEPATSSLRSVQTDHNGQKVYIGLISRPLTGAVEISLPGGPVIYSGDLSELQRLRRENTVLDIPLATVKIEAGDLTDPFAAGAPTYGDPSASGLFEFLSHEQVQSLTRDIAIEARQADSEAGLETAFEDLHAAPGLDDQPEGTRSEPLQTPKRNWLLIITVSLGLLLLIAASLTVLVILIRRKKTALPTNTVAASQFCRSCGTKLEADNMFCSECGQRV